MALPWRLEWRERSGRLFSGGSGRAVLGCRAPRDSLAIPSLVRVRAAGVNFAETLMRENRYAVTPPLPAVLGTEVAGTVWDWG